MTELQESAEIQGLKQLSPTFDEHGLLVLSGRTDLAQGMALTMAGGI